MAKRIWAAVAVILLLTMATSCSKESPAGKWMDEKETKPAQGHVTEPFTGGALKEPGRPALMVIVNNHRAARPQTGLDKADMVFEVLAEGEITRFAAFYHSELEGTVGPVRSARPYYLELADGSGAAVAHAGGSKDAMAAIKQEGIPSLDGLDGAADRYRRENFRRPPHNLYADLEGLLEGAKAKGYAPHEAIISPYRFDDKGAVTEGKAATRVDLTYHPLYEAGYRYDPEAGRYIRYTQGEKQTDRETEKPLAMDNVLVISARHRIADSAGHRDVDWDAGGKGMLFQHGKGVAVTWKREQGWIVPMIDGKPALLLPGKTWVNVLPDEGGVTWK